MLEHKARFAGVTAENVGCSKPLDEAVAAFGDLLMGDRLQIHLEGDSDITEFVLTALVLDNLLTATKERIADGFRGSL